MEEEEELVGFDGDVRQLMDYLLSEISWSFISMIGIGRSGKTALARKVYKLAHDHFDHLHRETLSDELDLYNKIRTAFPEMGWELFRKKAFQGRFSPGVCPDYLSNLGKEIVKRCSGIPLVIEFMKTLLFSYGNGYRHRHWKSVLANFDQELLHNPVIENRVFQASYRCLPSRLQYCFLILMVVP